MDCPNCNTHMADNGTYGYLALYQSGEILGHTFKCPNASGFESEELAIEYLESSHQTMEDLGVSDWTEVTCDSAMHRVSGSFYTDKQGNLHEGYPC